MGKPLFLNAEEVYESASFRDCVEAVREAYRERGEGSEARPRTTLSVSETGGKLKGYMALLPQSGVMGGYIYSVGFQSSGSWNVLPLFDAKSGELLALLDASSINPIKTGSVGAVGTDALCRDDIQTIGVFGSSKQAKGQLLALDAIRDFSEVRVYSPTEEHREDFASKMAEYLDLDVVAANDSREVTSMSDVIITATNSSTPVFAGDDLQDGTHVTSIGQYHPDKRELDTATMLKGKYVPDLVERAHQDAGSFLIPKRAGEINETRIHAELGKVVCGSVPGREDRSEITIFDSGGTAIETVAAAYTVYKRAKERGMGQPLEFRPSHQSPGRSV